jgi:hypothetical protein
MRPYYVLLCIKFGPSVSIIKQGEKCTEILPTKIHFLKCNSGICSLSLLPCCSQCIFSVTLYALIAAAAGECRVYQAGELRNGGEEYDREITKLTVFSIFGTLIQLLKNSSLRYLVLPSLPFAYHLHAGEITAMGLSPATAYVDTVDRVETLALSSQMVHQLPEEAREAITALARLRYACICPKE